jgi:hypothetical protein
MRLFSGSKRRSKLPSASADFLLALLFDTEDAGDVLFGNAGLHPHYTEFNPENRTLQCKEAYNLHISRSWFMTVRTNVFEEYNCLHLQDRTIFLY